MRFEQVYVVNGGEPPGDVTGHWEGQMAGKLGLLVGFGAGYVLGTRSGRERYDQIAGKAQELWSSPRIHEKAEQVQRVAKKKAEQAQQVAKEKVGDKVNGRAGSATPSNEASGSGVTSGTGTKDGASS
jgi:hypothetical protein